MCMIAYRPANAGNIPNAVIDTAIARHSDGFGVAYRVTDAKGTRLVSEKFGPSRKKAFRKALKRVDRSGGEYVAHFRFATHGPEDEAHAHPYEYNDPDPSVGKVLVFHNGVIGIRTTAEESDTQVFVRDVLAQMPSRWWLNGAMRYLVNEAIGWSKLTIMTAAETFNMHEARGDWDGGLWYSSDHKPAKPTTWGRWDNDAQAWRMPDGSLRQSALGAGGGLVTTPTRKYISGYTDKDGTWVNGYYEDEPAKATSGKGEHGLKPITSLVPYASRGAVSSAAALGLLTATAPPITDEFGATAQFTHGGHNLTAIRDIPMHEDGDFEDAVICDECQTIGTVYVMDGGSYIDMAHLYPDDSEDLLPEYGVGARTLIGA